MAQNSFAWTYRMLVHHLVPDPERSDLALRTILRLLSGPDPPRPAENHTFQRRAVERDEKKTNKPKDPHLPGTD